MYKIIQPPKVKLCAHLLVSEWHDLWPSMVKHTRNLCSAFHASKCTHTAVSSDQEHSMTNPGNMLK